MATSTQNILESIVSPKIINDGSGGYKVKTDILNVDMIQHSNSQCGQATISYDGTSSTVTIANHMITASSIILVTMITMDIIIGTPAIYAIKLNPGVGFTIVSGNRFDSSTVSWFIAKY